jgi:hypothetical protein
MGVSPFWLGLQLLRQGRPIGSNSRMAALNDAVFAASIRMRAAQRTFIAAHGFVS